MNNQNQTNQPLDNRLYTCLPVALVTLILFFLTHYIFGFYAETNDDLAFVWAMKGYVSLQPITDFLYYHHGLASFYTFLYALTSKIAWYGWAMYIYLVTACVLVYFILEQREKPLWQNLILYLAFFAAILYSQLVYFNFTRPAFLLIITSFLWALKRQVIRIQLCPMLPLTPSKEEILQRKSQANEKNFLLGGIEAESDKISKKISQKSFYSYFDFHFLSWFTLFVIGFLTRPTTAYLSLTLLVPISLYLAWRNQCLKQISRKIYLPVFLLIVAFHLLQWASNTPEKQKIIDKQAAIAQLVNAKITKNPERWTRRDSVIYQAAIYWLVGDNETLTKEQLSKYTFEGEVVLNATTLQKIPAVLQELKGRTWQSYKAVLCWLLVLFGVCIWQFLITPTSSKRKKAALQTGIVLLLFQLFFVVVLVGVNITMKMPNRVLEPLLLLNMLLSSMLSSSHFWTKNTWLIGAVGMLFLAYFPAKSTFASTQSYRQAQIERQVMVAELNQKISDKTVVFTLPAAMLLEDAYPLTPLNLSSKNQYLFLQGWLTALPNFYASLARNSDGVSITFKNAFLQLVDNENFVFVSNEFINDLLKKYFEVVYGVELVFEEAEIGLESFERKGMKLYKVLGVS